MRNKDCSASDSAVQHLFHPPCYLFDTYIAGKMAYRAVGAPTRLKRICLCFNVIFFCCFFYWFASRRTYCMLHSEVHTGLPSSMQPSSAHNVCGCRNCFTVVVQVVSGLSSEVHPAHMHGHTHKRVFTIIQMRHKKNKEGGSASSLEEGKFCPWVHELT